MTEELNYFRLVLGYTSTKGYRHKGDDVYVEKNLVREINDRQVEYQIRHWVKFGSIQQMVTDLFGETAFKLATRILGTTS